MIWGAFDSSGTLPLAFISNRMNAQDYQDMLDEHLTPYWQEDYLFMQDNASIHRCASTMDFLKTHKIATLKWPACSPDLNPIENLWGIIVREVYRDNRQFSNVQDLKNAILQAWTNIPLLTLSNLVKSMPKRLLEVVKANGGPTKY